jgi:hypothetical protein
VNQRPTPETDEQRRIDNGETAPLLDFAETLEIRLAAERALADRLAEVLRIIAADDEHYFCFMANFYLDAWKEARSEPDTNA